MNWPALKLLYVHEMRLLLRSRRTVVTAIVIPAVMMPLMILGAQYAEQQSQTRLGRTTFQYAVTGTLAAETRALIQMMRNAEEFKSFHAVEINVVEPLRALEDGLLHFVIEGRNAEEADALLKAAGSGEPSNVVAGVPEIRVVYRGSQDMARRGAQRMVEMLRSARRSQSYTHLLEAGFPSHPEGILAMTAQNVATESQVSGSNVGRFFTFVLLIWMAAAGSIAAMDIIAGEKERGTLETLITSAAGRAEIVTAKQLTISTVALAITLIQTLNALFYVKLNIIQLPENYSLSISAGSILQLLSLYIPMAAAVSAALLIISAHSKTYKEAQLHFFPFYLVSLVPALAAVLPGLRLRSVVALVPIANVSVAAREVLMGRPDVPMMALTIAVMSVTAVLLIRHSAGLLAREDLVVSAQYDQAAIVGGQELFRKRVLQWFAVMWAIMFAAASVPALAGIRAQLLFNEIVIFAGFSLLILWRYRLNLREVAGFRRVRWQVWVAVLMAVPAAQVVARAFFMVVNSIIPMPQTMVRQQLGEQLTSARLPGWEMYLLVAILPAVCEEFAFRGILLHGLRRRFHPVLQCLFVGLLFGLFHYALFRIAPTAFLGVILTAIALMTRSILPGILFHAANNSFAIWSQQAGIDFARLDGTGYAVALVVFVMALVAIHQLGRETFSAAPSATAGGWPKAG
jgi:sodium transport system permease protein